MDVQCKLCPKACVIAPGQSGECRVRVNRDGRLLAVTYGHPCAVHVDPIEKKPLFHFLPGTAIFSIATAGCNLHCKNCQNWQISQQNPEDITADTMPPDRIVELACETGCLSVAYTYTEPVVYYEYTLDTCVTAKEAGLRNVLVTAGYINREPMERLCPFVDAANIDIKAMSESFYRDICGGTLKPVLDTAVLCKGQAIVVEITNLVIPTLNDNDSDLTALCGWVAENLGKETPLHFSRFHPDYRMRNLPPTPTSTLERAREIASAEGLHHIYVGNVLVPGGESTRCPQCGSLVVDRRGFTVIQNRLRNGACPDCGAAVYGVWS